MFIPVGKAVCYRVADCGAFQRRQHTDKNGLHINRLLIHPAKLCGLPFKVACEFVPLSDVEPAR